jgi:hypothetical protein
MPLRKFPGLRGVSVKEVRALSKLAWVRDDALSDETFEARVLPDGRVLAFLSEDDRAVLYPSREALAEVNRECAKTRAQMPTGPIDVARTLLPPLDDFLRDVEVHAKSLGKVLRLPDAVLDGTQESLNAVDKAVWRMPRAKRMTPEVVTPLVAYVGEVMRRVCEGRWTRLPATWKERIPVCEPSAVAEWEVRYWAWTKAREKALADALARGLSHYKASLQADAETHQLGVDVTLNKPKPIRFDVVERPMPGHETEPVIRARSGGLLQPFAVVVKEFELGGRGSLWGAINGTLMPYLIAARTGASGDGSAS